MNDRSPLGQPIPNLPPQYVEVGDHRVLLPKGITVAHWEAEKRRWQNARIRCLLGCIRLLEEVNESNYAILHCSPDRLTEILRRTRQVAVTLREELVPLFEAPSVIPELEQALEAGRTSLAVLGATALDDLEQLRKVQTDEEIVALRKLLCVSIGQLHGFLQDNFVRLVAGDPRSHHDTDYFLSKRFAHDVEEAEWLHYSVANLSEYLEVLEKLRPRLTRAIAGLRRDEMVPGGERWRDLSRALQRMTTDLVPRLRAVLSLRGIRFDEMEVLDQYAAEIPIVCRVIQELGASAHRAADSIKHQSGDSRPEREQAVRDLVSLHFDFSTRMVELLEDLERTLRGLLVFVPFWLQNLERRRALILRRTEDCDEHIPQVPGRG